MNPLKLSLAAHATVLLAAFAFSFLHGCASTDNDASELPMFTLISDDEPVDQPDDEPILEDPVPPPPPPPPPPLPPDPQPIVEPEPDAIVY
jgi:outer membrane biosynthesis protein TonB